MEKIDFTSIDTILSKFHRDLKEDGISETDLIEWIGEALGFLKVPQIQEESIQFIEVKDYMSDIPNNLQSILQIARNHRWSPETKNKCCEEIAEAVVEEIEDCDSGTSCNNSDAVDCNGNRLFLFNDPADNRLPFVELTWEYSSWCNTGYYQQSFTPVRLANHTFFGSLVCQEKQTPYTEFCGEDEYTIVGSIDKKLRFSFREGQVAISYLKNAIDSFTGYPLIPDNIRHITAISYYIRWKIAERYDWNNREGFAQKAADNERKWGKYVRQANNFMKIPKTIDQYQNILEQSHYLIPRHRRYYNYFGNLGREENRKFNDPDHRRKLTHYYLTHNARQ